MSIVTDLRVDPIDPLAAQVEARSVRAAHMLCDALAEVAQASTLVAEAVGHNRPVADHDHARWLMAMQQAAAASGAYQTLALLEQSQRGSEAVVVPLGVVSDEPDPLAEFRGPDGSVCYRTVDADSVKVGQWVQACHGDLPDDWALVDGIHPSGAMVALDVKGQRRWWERTGAIRVACTAAEVVARIDPSEVRP